MNLLTEPGTKGALPSVPRYYGARAFHSLKNAEPLAGDNSAWRAMAEEGSKSLLAAMLRYYARHHPQSLGLAIADAARDKARAHG